MMKQTNSEMIWNKDEQRFQRKNMQGKKLVENTRKTKPIYTRPKTAQEAYNRIQIIEMKLKTAARARRFVLLREWDIARGHFRLLVYANKV